MVLRSEKYARRASMMQEVLGSRTMKSILIMVLLTVGLAAQAQAQAQAQPPKPDVADVLMAVSEQLKPLFVSEHELAEMRDGFFGRKDISDEETAHVDDVLTTTKAFRKALDPVYSVGGLVAEMRLPEDADTVRRKFYITAANMVVTADFSITHVNKSMEDLHNSAAKAQAARVRDAMIAIRDTLKALPK
jgi:hypothetical protein